jgi:hypothetical protein
MADCSPHHGASSFDDESKRLLRELAAGTLCMCMNANCDMVAYLTGQNAAMQDVSWRWAGLVDAYRVGTFEAPASLRDRQAGAWLLDTPAAGEKATARERWLVGAVYVPVRRLTCWLAISCNWNPGVVAELLAIEAEFGHALRGDAPEGSDLA